MLETFGKRNLHGRGGPGADAIAGPSVADEAEHRRLHRLFPAGIMRARANLVRQRA